MLYSVSLKCLTYLAPYRQLYDGEKEQKRAVTETDGVEHSLWYPHVQRNVKYQNENFDLLQNLVKTNFKLSYLFCTQRPDGERQAVGLD